MIQAELKHGRYSYLKSLIFNLHGIEVMALKNNHLLYTLDLKGLIHLPFYIIGVNYEVSLCDRGMTAAEKYFNYNDPLFFTHMQIMAESTNDIHGDNINHTLTPDDPAWKHYSMSFQPGRVYNLSSFPIVITEPKFNIIFDVFIDPSYVIVGNQLECIPSFKLFVGTN